MQGWLRSMVVTIVVGSGCATIIKGSSQDVRVETNPPGAMVYVDGNPVGPAPQTLKLKQDDHHITATLPGMQGHAAMSTGFSGWSLLFFPVGTIIDAVTGAITTLDDERVQVTLVRVASAAPAPWASPPAAPGAPR